MFKNKPLLFVVVGLVVVLAGFFSWRYFSGGVSTGANTATGSANAGSGADFSTSTRREIGGIGIVGPGNVSVTPVPVSGIEPPSLNRSITFQKDADGAFRKAMTANINNAVKVLKQNPDDFSSWLSLAILRKQIDDYVGAREIWEYLNLAYPTQSISFGNLGELYHLYLKNYPKSETNYKQAIKTDPTQVNLYRGLFELYKYSYKTDTSAAADILKQGLVKNPGNSDFLILLAKYFAEKKDYPSAVSYYDQAIKAAGLAGNTALVSLLKAERDGLPK